MISCSLSPNTQIDDVILAIKTVFTPWRWKFGRNIELVEAWFLEHRNESPVFFNSGRSAFLAILKAFDIGKGDEVLVQAFTCVAVPNSVHWAGAKAVFVDIDSSYNLDPNDVEAKITKRTKAIVVQHTFGIPADLNSILAFAKKHNLLVIEDFAHTMTLPTRGDAAFFSFGRDKVLSSVWGGAAVISSKYKVLSSKLKQYQESLPMSGYCWIFQQLLHPIAFSLILTLYDVVIGKVLLVLLQRLKLLSFPVYKEEKTGGQPAGFPAKYPNALAALLFNQLKKLDRYSKIRKQAVRVYGGTGILLRYPMRVDNPNKIIRAAKKHGILLGNWYHNVIDPESNYEVLNCPKAQDAAKHIVNLPTLISVSDAERLWKDLS